MENKNLNRRSFLKESSLGALGLITVPAIITGCAGSGSNNGRISEAVARQDVKGLVFATPESQGVPSDAIMDMLDFWEAKQVCMHSFVLMRHGAVIAEGY